MEAITMDGIETGDVWALRKVGLQALNTVLGEDGTRAFLRQWSGNGTGRDCVKARKELNKTITNEEIMTGIMKLQAENKVNCV